MPLTGEPGISATVAFRRAARPSQPLEVEVLRSRGVASDAALLSALTSHAAACAASALCRTESRSAHYRSDFPKEDSAWVQTVLYDRNGVSTRSIETDPEEGALLAFRKAHASADSHSEREHVE